MKVGVYAGDDPPDAGGGYTFVQETLKELERRSASSRHHFVLLRHRALDGGKLDSLLLPPSWSLPLVSKARRKLGRAFIRAIDRPDLDHDHVSTAAERVLRDAAIEVIWYLVPNVSLTPNIPYVTVVWDLQHRVQPFFPEVNAHGEFDLREKLAKRVLPRATLVITGTAVGREEITRAFGIAPERTRLLPHPTPSDALDAASATTARPALAPAKPYLLYPAQFWPHKNHVNLLEALRLLRADTPFELVLAGSDKGNLAHVRAYAAKLGVTDAVHFLGFVPRSDLLALYQHAFALTYVTFFGPENLPPLEAFALGCPVVASEVAGSREQLGDAALLVDPTKPEQIADAVRRLQATPALRADLIDRGRARASRFTNREFVDDMLQWLDEFEPVRRCWP
jgi:glycosyltransferase involved in cell wall biosynthesis